MAQSYSRLSKGAVGWVGRCREMGNFPVLTKANHRSPLSCSPWSFGVNTVVVSTGIETDRCPALGDMPMGARFDCQGPDLKNHRHQSETRLDTFGGASLVRLGWLKIGRGSRQQTH